MSLKKVDIEILKRYFASLKRYFTALKRYFTALYLFKMEHLYNNVKYNKLAIQCHLNPYEYENNGVGRKKDNLVN
jgi:hypothetical protein